MCRAALVLFTVLLASGCAGRRPPQTYRLLRYNGALTLVPPGVAGASLSARAWKPGIPAGPNSCAAAAGLAVTRTGRAVRLTVTREALEKAPPAWLIGWASDLERRGCVAPGTANTLAERVAESLPLDPATAWRLMNQNDIRGGFIDLKPGVRLQVDSPILRDDAPPGALAIDSAVVTGAGHSLTIEAKASPALLGFERAWYQVAPRKGQPGAAIEALSAVRHIDGAAETRPSPAVNPFRFDRAAAWYRLLYRADRTIVVLGTASYSELDRLTREVDANPSACQALAGRSCVLIPRNVGVNPNIVVRVRGQERTLPIGATVAAAVRAAEGDPQGALASLTLLRPYAGRLTPVQFDRSTQDVLSLRLSGGEALAW
jgi:hypothetical protein